MISWVYLFKYKRKAGNCRKYLKSVNKVWENVTNGYHWLVPNPEHFPPYVELVIKYPDVWAVEHQMV